MMEGDEGTCEVPGSASCCGGWGAAEEEEEDDGGGGGREGVAEEGSTEKVCRELGVEGGGREE